MVRIELFGSFAGDFRIPAGHLRQHQPTAIPIGLSVSLQRAASRSPVSSWPFCYGRIPVNRRPAPICGNSFIISGGPLPVEICFLHADNQTIMWQRNDACTIDVLDFDAAVARASTAGKQGDRAGEIEALEDAARLCQDDLLRGLFDDWVQSKREHYRQQLSSVLTRLVACFEARRDYPSAIRHAERLAAQDPLCESHYQLLIRLYSANDDRASALRAYHQCMRTLRREMGVEPGPATRELFDRLLKGASRPPAVPAGTSQALSCSSISPDWTSDRTPEKPRPRGEVPWKDRLILR